jgi:hypothetical protein
LSDAVLPIYVLHLTFVVLVGFYVVQWTDSIWARFLVITIVSTVGTLAAYDLVRRIPVTRVLLGMRLRRGAPRLEAPERRSVGGLLRANLWHLGLWATAAALTLLVVVLGSNPTLTGRWQQTYDTAQAATGYIAEFREDGTWTATASDASIEGTYELIKDGQMRLAYPDGTVATAEYRISADRFGLISAESGRQQVFRKIH